MLDYKITTIEGKKYTVKAADFSMAISKVFEEHGVVEFMIDSIKVIY